MFGYKLPYLRSVGCVRQLECMGSAVCGFLVFDMNNARLSPVTPRLMALLADSREQIRMREVQLFHFVRNQ